MLNSCINPFEIRKKPLQLQVMNYHHRTGDSRTVKHRVDFARCDHPGSSLVCWYFDQIYPYPCLSKMRNERLIFLSGGLIPLQNGDLEFLRIEDTGHDAHSEDN